ncbi:MAG: putative zinc-binding metallopeptidase [Bdellovibrionales bacterium]|nr:putative zinc-binding metallopeptidase [Bdellovibrionales bacterium]
MIANNMLHIKISDLDLCLESSWVWPHIQKLYRELEHKAIDFKPHIWVSDDWYCPDGVAGFAIPFYLLNTNLINLEKRIIGEAEGETSDWLMMLLRHETAHALDNAYHLRKNKRRQNLFGLTSKKYPLSYTPRPHDKNYVQHLDEYYAQAHPDEDWAETFAIWLNPKSNWREVYKNWPCIKKIELCDEIINKIKNKRPLCQKVIETEPFTKIDISLKNYYDDKKRRLKLLKRKKFEELLIKEISIDTKKEIQKEKTTIKTQLCHSLNRKEHFIDKFIEDILEICSRHKIKLKKTKRNKKISILELLKSSSDEYFKSGIHKVYM